MERKTSIHRNSEEETTYLSLLNLHFKTVTYEKYIDASLNMIFTQARDRVLGKNFQKERISKKKGKKIKLEIIRKIHGKYGKYVNLTYFKIKDVSKIVFQTNLDSVFTVPGYGKLYGCYYKRPCGNIFLTEHCLKRFEERANEIYFAPIKQWVSEALTLEPSTIDIISGLVMTSNFEYGRSDNHFHLNIGVGVLVIEDLGDIYIAKTFLSPEMFKQHIKWYRPDVPKDISIFKSFADVMIQCESSPVERPHFIEDYITEFIEKIKDSADTGLDNET